MTLLTFLVIFSTLSFLFFGVSCFFTEHMKNEFIRYGLGNRLRLIGTLQLLGATGLGIGYLFLPWLSIVASMGLAILMILGFGVRLKIRDTILQSVPSLVYAVINTYIAISLYLSY